MYHYMPLQITDHYTLIWSDMFFSIDKLSTTEYIPSLKTTVVDTAQYEGTTDTSPRG